jgi:hypothetical protein
VKNDEKVYMQMQNIQCQMCWSLLWTPIEINYFFIG